MENTEFKAQQVDTIFFLQVENQNQEILKLC